MYKAEAETEAKHVREVYEHEDYDIDVQNIVFSKQPTEMIVDGYCEY